MRRGIMRLFELLTMAASLFRIATVECFVVSSSSVRPHLAFPHQQEPPLTRRYNFFKGLLDKAFENDSNLINASDKITGQLDDSQQDDDDDNSNSQLRSRTQLTETQAKWQALQSQLPQLAGTTLSMNLYLAGVPERDPSSDLYASKTNISSRDRAVGLTLPTQPTVSDVQVAFLEDGVCRVQTESPFTRAQESGDWMYLGDASNGSSSSIKSNKDGTAMVRFRIPVTGYSRTVETKGTIQNVYWSTRSPDKDPEVRQTSTTYSIPAGWMYCDAVLTKTARNQLVVSDGVLKIERTSGFLGAATKMVPCGRIDASVVSAAATAD